MQGAARAVLMQRPKVPTGRCLPAAGATAAVRVTFLGNATLLLDDGETQLLTDGFFSRPGLLKTVLGPVHSNPDIVQSCLQRSAASRMHWRRSVVE